MTTATNWVVVANGTVSVPMTKAAAERIAKALREGRIGRKGGYAKVAAKVVRA